MFCHERGLSFERGLCRERTLSFKRDLLLQMFCTISAQLFISCQLFTSLPFVYQKVSFMIEISFAYLCNSLSLNGHGS